MMHNIYILEELLSLGGTMATKDVSIPHSRISFNTRLQNTHLFPSSTKESDGREREGSRNIVSTLHLCPHTGNLINLVLTTLKNKTVHSFYLRH